MDAAEARMDAGLAQGERKTNSEISWLEYNPQGQKTIVLLHGLGVTSESWPLQALALAGSGYRVLCPDIPGFGRSIWPERTWNLRIVSNNLADWIQQQANNPVDLVGLSMGGVIAQLICLERPHLVRRVGLVNTFARLAGARPGQVIYFLRRFFLVGIFGLKAQADLVARHIFPGESQEVYRQELVRQILQSDPRIYTSALISLGLVNLEKRLGEIRKLVLVISGEGDTTVPVQIQERLVKRIRDARQVIIPNAGHAVIVEQSEQFNRVLLEFLTAA